MQDEQQNTQPLSNEPSPAAETTPLVSVPAEVEPSSQPAPSPTDPIWISREEYQRLKQAEATRANTSAKGPAKLFGGMQIATSALAAVALLIGLMYGNFSLLTLVPVSLIILTLMGAFTWIDYLQAKKTGQIHEHRVRNVLMLVFAIFCLALPLAFPLFGLFFLMLMCGFGGCQGS